MMKTKKLFLLLAMLLMSIGASAQSQLKGDVNNDGKVDEADITAVIEIMKNGGGATDSNDVNKDGKVDVADIVAIIGIIKNGGSAGGEVFDPNSYYIYIGLNRPTSDTDIAVDLASNNTPLHEDMASMGWRKIGPDITIYNSSNPAYNGGGVKSTVCLDKNFNNVTCYVAIPVGMGIFDGLGNEGGWTIDQANITIKGHQYNVYKTVLEGEFGEIIYYKGGSSSGEEFDPSSYYIYIGLSRPTSETDIAADLASNNTPLYEGYGAAGWRKIGQDISIYNENNPAYNGGANTVIIDKNFNSVTCYVAIPVGMGIYDGLGNAYDMSNPVQSNITIKGHQYNVYKYTVDGEFTGLIYSKGGSTSNEDSYYFYIGLNRPTSATDPDSDLAANNTPLIPEMHAMGWQNIGQDISIYNVNNKAYNGGRTPICLNADFDDVIGYIAIPVGMNIYDGLGNVINLNIDQENVTIKGHQYNVLYRRFGGEFVLNIY